MTSKSGTLQSPLRYPGGKAFLCPYVETVLRVHKLRPHVFVEPFAGGASISLHLLQQDVVDKIALFDRDPLVSGFWWSVFNADSWLLEKLDTAEISLDTWKALREQSIDGHRNNGWKCLFLNRTSFSGILNRAAGPLGGMAQASAYGIDCRFYRSTIHERIERIAQLRDRVDAVETCDWRVSLDRYRQRFQENLSSCFIYLDPPFFNKAKKLYNYVFNPEEHEALIKHLREVEVPWLLSYDYCTEIEELFQKKGLHYTTVPVRYTSAKQNSPNRKKEIIASNLKLPKET